MRVIALSAESAMAAALNMMDGWEVVFADDPEEAGRAAGGAAVLLVGGGTDSALKTLEQLRREGIDIPAVVLGDTQPGNEVDSIVLTPPFTLDELRSAVEYALQIVPPARAASSPAPQPAVPEAPTTDPGRNGRNGALDLAEVQPPVEPTPAPRSEHVDTAPVTPRPEAAAPAEPREPEAPAPAQAPAPEPVVAEAPPAALAAPMPTLPPPTATPAAEPKTKRKRGLRRKDEPAAAVSVPADLPRDIPAKLEMAEEAARAIEQVLADLPFLADVEAMAEAVLGEVVEAFDPEIAAVYLPGPKGFWAAANHALTPAERKLIVTKDQALFKELLAGGEPILISPLDLARSMVTGIGGARTESMIAGPIHGHHEVVGVIVVGRHDFEDKDLDRLARLASEAGPGLAVSEALDRVRAFRA